jgi:hypothetical protein
VSAVIILGLLLVLAGFACVVSRGAMPGSTSARNVTLAHSQLFRTRGYQGNPSKRYRIVQVILGLGMLAGGLALIASSS